MPASIVDFGGRYRAGVAFETMVSIENNDGLTN